MAESVLYTDGAARAEAVGLRHGKHSSLPKRVAASHSLRQQQMRHAHTQTQRSHAFFFPFFFFFSTLKNVLAPMYTLPDAFPLRRVERGWIVRRDGLQLHGMNSVDGYRKESVLGRRKKKKKLLLNYKMSDPPLPHGNFTTMVCVMYILSSVTTQLNDITRMGMQKTHNMKVTQKI